MALLDRTTLPLLSDLGMSWLRQLEQHHHMMRQSHDTYLIKCVYCTNSDSQWSPHIGSKLTYIRCMYIQGIS